MHKDCKFSTSSPILVTFRLFNSNHPSGCAVASQHGGHFLGYHLPGSDSSPSDFLGKQRAELVRTVHRELVSLLVSVTQLCPTLCNPTDFSPPGFFVYGIIQNTGVGCLSLLRGKSSQRRDWTQQILYHLSHLGSPRVDRLKEKPEGPSREGSPGAWVGRFCDIFSGHSECCLLLGF